MSLAVGLTCDHEVLTNKGWRSIQTIDKGTVCATLNKSHYRLEYQECIAVSKSEQDCYKLDIHSDHFAIKCGQNQKIIVADASNKSRRLKYEKAIDCGKHYRFYNTCKRTENKIVPLHSIFPPILASAQDILELYAAWICGKKLNRVDDTDEENLREFCENQMPTSRLADWVWKLNFLQAEFLFNQFKLLSTCLELKFIGDKSLDAINTKGELQRLALHSGQCYTYCSLDKSLAVVPIKYPQQDSMDMYVSNEQLFTIKIKNNSVYIRKNGKCIWVGSAE